jgi:hypothetical protein
MNCGNAENTMLRYLEGAASLPQALLLKVHLLRCRSCRERLGALRGSQARLSTAIQTSVESPDIADAVMAMIDIAPNPVFRRRTPAWIAASTTAVAIVALLLILYSASRHGVPETTRVSLPAVRDDASRPPAWEQSPYQVVAAPKTPQPVVRETRLIRMAPTKHHKQHPTHSGTAPKPVNIVERMAVPPTQVEVEESQAPTPTIIVVVAMERSKSLESTVEVESTNSATGVVTAYTESRDETGRKVVAMVTCTPVAPEHEDKPL